MSAASAHIALHPFADGDTLATALAQTVADDLRAALSERGKASLALSGGSTPKRFLQALSRQPLDWAKVTATLVDERWVGEDSDRSNAALLRSSLLQHEAAAANFVSLYRAGIDVEPALPAIETALTPLLPLDVAVLGMGADGHTASFFPGGDRLAEALDPATPARVLPMRAPGAGEPRITLTLPVLLAAHHLYLHIEGAEKRAVLARAQAGDDLPVRAVLTQARAIGVFLTV
ncbi:MAG: 6-phosphogluconolactonase [Pseudoxanthomonas sp.]